MNFNQNPRCFFFFFYIFNEQRFIHDQFHASIEIKKDLGPKRDPHFTLEPLTFDLGRFETDS